MAFCVEHWFAECCEDLDFDTQYQAERHERSCPEFKRIQEEEQE